MERKKLPKKKKVFIQIYYWSWIILTVSMSVLIAFATYYQMETYFVTDNTYAFFKALRVGL